MNKIYIKYIVIAVVIIAIIVSVIFGYKKIKKYIDNKKLISAIEDEITVEKVSITNAQLNVYASKLYAAMDGCGTDEDAIYAVFENMSSRSDILSLINNFGVKDGMTLPEWIASELNASEIAHLNSIISSKGINYSF